MIILYVQPTLDVMWPEWIEMERERDEEKVRGGERTTDGQAQVPRFFYYNCGWRKELTVSLEHLAMS